jgi:hypothetical protein
MLIWLIEIVQSNILRKTFHCRASHPALLLSCTHLMEGCREEEVSFSFLPPVDIQQTVPRGRGGIHVENGYSQRFAFRVNLLLSPGKAGDTWFVCFFYYIAKVLKLNDESK